MRRLRAIFSNPWLAAGLVAGLACGQAAAGTYDDCVALAGSDPGQAEIEAQRWVQSGGGAPARHCRALALLAQGAERRAAELMVAIGTEDRTLPDPVRSEILIEAGDIFLRLGELGLGRDAASRALLLADKPRAALTLSARLKAEQGDWQGAASDLDGALAAGEPDAELLVLRAAARLRMGDKVAARGDLLWAAEIAPELATLWLERGTLEAANGDRDAARDAWLKAIELDRDGIVAQAARLRLQRMEAGDD